MVVGEIFNDGATPYAQYDNLMVMTRVMVGKCDEQPDKCPDNVWQEVMLPCYSFEPFHRPSFSEIADRLETILDACTDVATLLVGKEAAGPGRGGESRAEAPPLVGINSSSDGEETSANAKHYSVPVEVSGTAAPFYSDVVGTVIMEDDCSDEADASEASHTYVLQSTSSATARQSQPMYAATAASSGPVGAEGANEATAVTYSTTEEQQATLKGSGGGSLYAVSTAVPACAAVLTAQAELEPTYVVQGDATERARQRQASESLYSSQAMNVSAGNGGVAAAVSSAELHDLDFTSMALSRSIPGSLSTISEPEYMATGIVPVARGSQALYASTESGSAAVVSSAPLRNLDFGGGGGRVGSFRSGGAPESEYVSFTNV